jgi:hypothetical protein
VSALLVLVLCLIGQQVLRLVYEVKCIFDGHHDPCAAPCYLLALDSLVMLPFKLRILVLLFFLVEAVVRLDLKHDPRPLVHNFFGDPLQLSVSR